MKHGDSFMNDDKQPRLAEIFAEETRKYPWSNSLEPHYWRLFAGDKVIIEKPDGVESFADALWDLCLPPLGRQEFWHYTSMDAVESIVRTGAIWLHSLLGR